MSEASRCAEQQPACDDGLTPGEGQKDVCVLEKTSTYWKAGLENQWDSDEALRAETDSSSHCVTWTVYIALALPQGEETYKPRCRMPRTSEKAKEANQDSSSVVKSLQTQSCYHIEYKLFPGNTETTRVDLLVYGPVAKLCQDDEPEILRTWREGDQTWIGWAQSFKIPVDRDLLIKLVSHRVRLQIWNSKDKLSPQARYESRRAVSLPEDQSEEAHHGNGCVKTMVNKIRAHTEKKSRTCTNLTLFQSKAELRNSETEENTVPQSSGHQKLGLDSFSSEDIRKSGPASVEINPVPLLAGETVNEHFPVHSTGVADVLCNVSLDKPLMSEQLKAELNPLVITILSASALPSSPVPFHILQEECLPVYCQYKFLNLKPHKTNYHKQSANICFRDVNVIMTGLMSPEEVQELLSGPPLEIEVHDRDRKLDEERRTPTTYENMNSHGVACLNLSELLLGKKSLTMYLPIKCCRPVDRGESAERKRTESAGRRGPLPQGHYYENSSQLKVKVDIACPLSIKTSSREVGLCSAPFGRLVCLFRCDRSSMVMKLRSEILQINAAAFHLLDSSSQENIETALSNHLMNFKQDGSNDVDFVSGFHVRDTRTDILVIEGLKDKAVKRLWESCPVKLSENKEERVVVHYNSGLGFVTRLYASLDLCLTPIQLPESLESLVRNPRLPVRHAVPQACYQALSRLSHLSDVKLLDEAVQYDLFPSADMILSISKAFGISERQHEENTPGDTAGDTTAEQPARRVREKRLPPLNTTNAEYIMRRRHSQLKQQLKNFIQENIKHVHEESERLPKRDTGFLQVDVAADQPIHSYSIQTFNFYRRALELLQKEMAKMPGRRFTYSQQYHGATVEPGSTTPEPHAGSTRWLSGVDKPAAHPRQPDEARLEELKEPWRENVLHANVLKPTLSRDTWSWDRRSDDFQLYCKPSPFFGTPPAVQPAATSPDKSRAASRARREERPEKAPAEQRRGK